jgi:hypothetical protein
MAARWLANLLLALMLGLLALGVYHELTVSRLPQTLAGIDAADLRLIEVERTGEPRIRLERTSDGWRMLEPLTLDADPGRLDQLLTLIAAPVLRSFPAPSAALDELGLDPIKLSLRLDGLTLAFGGLDPLGQRRYVMADGLVHLIDDRYHHLLIAPPIDYGSRALLPHARPPLFATLNGVPLAAKSLKSLIGLTAERVEPMTGDWSGEPVQFKFADGNALRFLVSEDRRRWSRPDLKLRYVLTDGMLLELDPTAIDPTPPTPPPDLRPKPPAAPSLTLPSDTGALTDDALAPDPMAPDPDAPETDPDAPVSTDRPGAPPSVKLSPDDMGEGRTGFGDELYKDPPTGFGVDPFAPDPEAAAPETGDTPGGAWRVQPLLAPPARRP